MTGGDTGSDGGQRGHGGGHWEGLEGTWGVDGGTPSTHPNPTRAAGCFNPFFSFFFFLAFFGFVQGHCQRLLARALPGRFLLVLLQKAKCEKKDAMLWGDGNWQTDSLQAQASS